MDKLTEMHLLLREHGWEPEYDDQGVPHGGSALWRWTHARLAGTEVWTILVDAPRSQTISQPGTGRISPTSSDALPKPLLQE